MGTTAIHDLTAHIGQHATLNSGGPRMLIEGVTPDQEYVCSWNDPAGERQVSHFPAAAVQVEPAPDAAGPSAAVSEGEDISDEEATAFNRAKDVELLVGFLAWLATRDEQVGPFSRNHLVDRAQASRVAAEYLTAQA